MRTTICHMEDRSQSNGLHLRYEEIIEVDWNMLKVIVIVYTGFSFQVCNMLKFIVIVHTGSAFQEVLYCQ